MAEQFTDAMEYIWERVPKTKEGLIHYLPGDIPYLYRNGFVDAQKFPFKTWKAAFDDCLQSDGTYLVSKDKFFSLRVFRYAGPVFKPFDAYKVREGVWNENDLQKLFDLSIEPSSTLPEETFWNSVKTLKAAGHVQDGQLLINDAVKKHWATLIEQFPSPRRRLEKEVNRLNEERESEFRAVTENRDSSAFVAGKLASEDKMAQFKNLESKNEPKANKAPAKAGKEIDIKKLRRPSRKISG